METNCNHSMVLTSSFCSLMSHKAYEIRKAPLFPGNPLVGLPALKQMKLHNEIRKSHAVYEQSLFTECAIQSIIMFEPRNITVRHRSTQIFQKSSSHIKFLYVRRVTRNFHIEKPLTFRRLMSAIVDVPYR